MGEWDDEFPEVSGGALPEAVSLFGGVDEPGAGSGSGLGLYGPDERELIELEGQVEQIIFQNEQNGYTVASIEMPDELITAVGNMPFLAAGENVRLLGQWVNHPSFGRQFKVEGFEKSLPATGAMILRYLSSRAIKGIGPVTAERLVEKYGDNTFEVIEQHPEWLESVKGITPKRAQEIHDSFKEQFGMRSVMMFFSEHFGPATVMRIYKKWGAGAVDVVKQNPYTLCDNIWGVGFERADKLSKSVGLAKDSPERVEAGVKYVLRHNSLSNGHLFLPAEKLIEVAAQLLGVDKDAAKTALDNLLISGQLHYKQIGGLNAIYTDQAWRAETYVAQKLLLIHEQGRHMPAAVYGDGELDRLIDQIEAEEGIQYAASQRSAIHGAAEHGVMLLTGGPGTGKTTVIKAIIRIYERIGLDIALAAPTGRAAKRMSETCSMEAKTIHRLLEMVYSEQNEPVFNRNEENLLSNDVLIIDETSMVDIFLMMSLLRAVKPGAKLLFIGDADQLPPVGAGNALDDMIESGRFFTVRLTEIFRQAQQSLIITNAHRIDGGEYPVLDAKTEGSDFFLVRREGLKSIAASVVDLCAERLPRKYGAALREQIQVITPSKKGTCGTGNLNVMLQQVLNPASPKKRERKFADTVLREGDRVMQVRNNYALQWTRDDGTEGAGVFNGDIGVLEQIDPDAGGMRVKFDDRIAQYDETVAEELVHAYAITVHKSQGSEYPVVVIPAGGEMPRLLTRNLLYTAVTRAQRMVVLVGREDVIDGMVDNNRQSKRYTGLKYLLEEM